MEQIPSLNESMLQRFIETISCKSIIIDNNIKKYSTGYTYFENLPNYHLYLNNSITDKIGKGDKKETKSIKNNIKRYYS